AGTFGPEHSESAVADEVSFAAATGPVAERGAESVGQFGCASGAELHEQVGEAIDFEEGQTKRRACLSRVVNAGGDTSGEAGVGLGRVRCPECGMRSGRRGGRPSRVSTAGRASSGTRGFEVEGGGDGERLIANCGSGELGAEAGGEGQELLFGAWI